MKKTSTSVTSLADRRKKSMGTAGLARVTNEVLK